MAVSSTSISNKVWKFVHRKDEYFQTNLKGISYNQKEGWYSISENGLISIHATCKDGYAWDGCTPKFVFIDLIFGTPDGKLDILTEKQICYYASMVHDMIYQFKDQSPISRKDTDQIFRAMLKQSGFKLWWIYYSAVRCFGGFFGKWKTKKSNKDIEVLECSWIEEIKARAKAKSLSSDLDHPFLG